MKRYLAIDIGASSGRHILGWLEGGKIRTKEVYRFENGAAMKNGLLCWDVDALFSHVLAGLRVCGEQGMPPQSVSIDTWGVDFVLLGADGNRLGEAVAYRDKRTDGMDSEVERYISFPELYARTGIQKQPFNTIYQLMALKKNSPELLEQADKLLFVPDYLHYRLCGELANEYTEASTSALVNAHTRDWDWELLRLLGLPERLFMPVTPAGTALGGLTPAIQKEVGFNCLTVLPASHDTGSAYLSVPAKDDRKVYVSSGTWSLLGIESEAPIINEEGRAGNFTNEGGYNARTRFLQNIAGLWMIQSVRNEQGRQYSFAQLEEMAKASEYNYIIDPNDPAFFAPESMIGAVKTICARGGFAPPETIGDVMRCIYLSLAECYAHAVRNLEKITGRKFTGINIVGGGTKDGYLNGLTAKASGLPVWAGPTEGTVIGNLIVQFIADGVFENLREARCAVAESFEIKEYLP
ncbi:MAG: rhamnulokinase [Oscillospiraceae bacterium]|nr:rhamnulokinase [Oscillospiraceae bacterium]